MIVFAEIILFLSILVGLAVVISNIYLLINHKDCFEGSVEIFQWCMIFAMISILILK